MRHAEVPAQLRWRRLVRERSDVRVSVGLREWRARISSLQRQPGVC